MDNRDQLSPPDSAPRRHRVEDSVAAAPTARPATSDSVAKIPGPGEPNVDSPAGVPAESVARPPALVEIERADTVIRGSSRAAEPRPQWDPTNRSPAAVAGVLRGHRLNHFHLLEMIGGGGMGAVFRAQDEQLDRVVAIKVIPFVSDDADLERRFRNEAKSAAKLDHPHIARVFDVGSQDRWHYIVFEYINGTNIRDQVTRQGVMTIDDSVFYVCQLAEAIGHAASRGIVHRDIKPSNVLICGDQQIKLVDMGLARSESFDMSEDMTASGVTLGTFDYISPEQARDPRDADLRSDLYSLGCTFYYMLTGEPPYPGGTMLQKLLSHGNAPPPDARALRSGVSADLQAVLDRMLAKSPSARYQSVTDLLADLREVAARESLSRTLGIGVPVAASPNPVLVRLLRHLPWVVAVALLVLTTLSLHVASMLTDDSMAVPRPVAAQTLAPGGATVFERVTSGEPPEVNFPPESGDRSASPEATSAAATGAGSSSGSSSGAETTTDATDSDVDDATRPPRLLNDFPLPPELSGTGSRSPLRPIRPPLADAEPNSSPDRGSSAGNAAQGVGPVVNAIDRIRVIGTIRSMGQRSDPEVIETRSLANAIELCEKYGVDEIELATKRVYTPPLVIESELLKMRSSVGGTEVIFELPAPGSALGLALGPTERSAEPVAMITVNANRIECESLHFLWRVPETLGSRGGALFGLGEDKRVRLNRCTVTIENPSGRPGLFAFDSGGSTTDGVPPDGPRRVRSGVGVREDANRRGGGPAALPLVSVGLNDVVIRGEIGLLRLDRAVELQLRWENGLLAISRAMVRAVGSATRLGPGTDGIRLSLNDLTVYAPEGLVHLALSAETSFPVFIDREARRSLFVVDSDFPHLDFRGDFVDDADGELGDVFAELEDVVQISGESNAYHAPGGGPNLFVRAGNSAEPRLRLDLKTVLQESPEWCVERSARLRVRWSSPDFAEIPPSQMVPANFAQDGELGSGLVAESLPDIPFFPPQTPPTTR